jgi:hypothetical protein
MHNLLLLLLLLRRAAELQEAVARQLLSSDPALQTAALRCLASFKLAFLPAHLLNVLLQLADVAKLRNGLVNIPILFDQNVDQGVDQAADEVQRQQQRHTLKKKKGGSGDVGRVDPHTRPGEERLTVRLPFCFGNGLTPYACLLGITCVGRVIMFDQNVEQGADEVQRQQQRHTLKKNKGGSGDSGRVDPHTRPGEKLA